MCFPNNFGMKTWRSDSGLLITVLSLAYFKSSVQRIAEMQRMRTEGPDRIFFFEVNDDFQSGMICLILPKRSESSCGCSASCKYCSILKKKLYNHTLERMFHSVLIELILITTITITVAAAVF